VPSPNVRPHSVNQSNCLLGLTANSPTDIWAFGSYLVADGSGHQMTLLLHWDGTSWKTAPSPNPTKGTFVSDLLFAGIVPSSDNVWSFGDFSIVDTLVSTFWFIESLGVGPTGKSSIRLAGMSLPLLSPGSRRRKFRQIIAQIILRRATE